MAAHTVAPLFSSAQLTSPERISADLLKQLCHTCAVTFDVLLAVGALLILTLVFLGARASAVRRAS